MKTNLKELPENYVKIIDDPSGSGDQLIEFSDEFMEKNGWLLGDEISFEIVDGSILLKNKTQQDRQKMTSSKKSKKKKS